VAVNVLQQLLQILTDLYNYCATYPEMILYPIVPKCLTLPWVRHHADSEISLHLLGIDTGSTLINGVTHRSEFFSFVTILVRKRRQQTVTF